ncbi:3',5'-cyclic-nucleotide phosphodiesterase pde1 [Pichia californica]|uniref:3',5'-cyclic-nucleotide phosphodiesterase pde1 n=1 Tax=Pichia californica TaxID=460514 RepID=A0A9P7BE00_9ASCO|nr:3',5'-cyclic-nucleotide phosphodiesterase pde1 [[Candida] californica]KAG0686570.1 3',5'-cyclic-nucleotide phosphodiesterase pde1 [[Candida] californica]
MPKNKKHFELTILGCSGGPISGKTCSFLIKPTDINYNSILNGDNDSFLAIDAGTGLSAIVDILKACENDSYLKSSYLLDLYSNPTSNGEKSVSDLISTYINTKNLSLTTPFDKINFKNQSHFQIGDKLLNSINAYLITHSHLDHVSSLIINSPAFTQPKKVFGLNSTIDSIKDNLFNSLVWPDLVSMGIVSLNPIQNNKINNNISKRYEVTPFKISHGIKSGDERYISTAFLLNDTKFDYSILFFGDVETDLISNCNYNLIIWKYIAPMILQDKFSSIIIECSTIDKPPPLFGHMIPSYLIYELTVLRKICIDSKDESIKLKNLKANDPLYINATYQPLQDLNVIIIHVKETLEDVNPRYLILNKLNELNKEFNLKINFTVALSGLSFVL